MREVNIHLNVETNEGDDREPNALADAVLDRLANPFAGFAPEQFDHLAALVEMDLDACAGASESPDADEDEKQRERLGEELSALVAAAREITARTEPPRPYQPDVPGLGAVCVPLAEDV